MRRTSQEPRHPNGRILATVALLLVVLFAGCVDGDTQADPDDPEGDPNGQDGDGASAPVEAPEWQLGDHWTFDTTDGGRSTLAVVGDGGTDWEIATDDPDLAFFHAREEVSLLGAQRKSDLAGSQGTDRVVFFKWPLQDGSEWTTPWDGVERRIVVDQTASGVFVLTAFEGDTPAVRYGYDATVRWFTHLHFLTPDGTVAFGWDLAEHGRAWTGTVIDWDLDTVWEVEGESWSTLAVEPPVPFEVAAGTTDVYLIVTIGCTDGHFAYGVTPLPWDDQSIGRRVQEECTAPHTFQGSLGHRAGEWSYDILWSGTSADLVHYAVLVRTLNETPFPT